MRRTLVAVAVLAVAVGAGPVTADVWDTATDTDDNVGTDNVPIHGSVQVHDLGVRPGPVADQDWYSITVAPYTSYEAIIDGLTGDTASEAAGPLGFDWVAADGTTILTIGTPLFSPGCINCTQTARYWNTGATPAPVFIRVRNPGCALACNSTDQYTFRLLETTYSIPRFNNVGSQTTVLLIQNTAHYTVTTYAHFWGTSGAFLGTHTMTISPLSLAAVQTASLGFASGVGGSITVSNNGRYGDLTGKAVALEPSTGFSFDTPMVPKPR